jgi:hypothetical protein
MQKAIRRSQPKEAVYWGLELWLSGYDNWAWSRLNEILSEDIGLADRYLPAQIKALEETSKFEHQKKRGGGLQFVHAVLLMATARKSRLVDWLAMEIPTDHAERLDIPDEALDRHTRRGLRMGRGWDHFLAHGALLIDPDPAANNAGYDDMEAWLKHIDQESEHHFERMQDKDPTLPKNPWTKRRKVASTESWLPPDEDPQQELSTEEKGK